MSWEPDILAEEDSCDDIVIGGLVLRGEDEVMML